MTENDKKTYIHLMKHAIGLDHARPKREHGRLCYTPYRNRYWTNGYSDEKWRELVKLGFAEGNADRGEAKSAEEDAMICYWVTPKGREWLAKQLGIYRIYE